MSAFVQSFRALEADHPRASLAKLGAVCGLLAAWLFWFALGAVPIYEATDSARVEVYDAAHGVDAPVAGQVKKNLLVVGRHFAAGEALVELDATLEAAKLEEERTALLAVAPEIASLRRQVEARERAVKEETLALRSALSEARTKQTAARELAASASTEATRAAALHQSGVMPELERMHRETEARQTASLRDALLFGTERADREGRARGSSGRADVEGLRRELVSLEGRMRVLEASVLRWQAEVARRVLRAPVDGTVAEALPLVAGAYVREGERLGTVVPRARLKIVAQFPETAIGRIKAGQAARLRLTGFSWVEFGAVKAVVLRAASEVRDGKVRVELEPAKDSVTEIPLQHGMPGSVEVLVERVTPLSLVLRNAGYYLGRAAREPDAP